MGVEIGVKKHPFLKKIINTDHGHVITGDLDIVNDHTLRRIMKLGTKFRLPSKFNLHDILKQFEYDLSLFIYNLAISYNKPTEYFNEWKHHVINSFVLQLNSHKFHLMKANFKNLKSKIAELQKQFLITYIDKSANNYAIICKAYYKELLTESIHSNILFKKTKDNTKILNRKILNFHKLLKLKHNNLQYPYIVLIPKFHKKPLKFRSVMIGCKTYNNVANKTLLNILNQLYDCTLKNDNIHCIKNSLQLVEKIKLLNNISNLQSYDFKDLFNNIDISDLHRVINLLFTEYHKSINLPEHITTHYFKTLTNFIIHNNYIQQNKAIYKQVQGIPQGGASSSILSDLYLYFYERSFQNNNFYFYRYIDDVLVIYTTNSIISDLPDIYPNKLELTKTNLKNNSINFLDLNIKLLNNSLIFDLYDKRKAFSFNVNLFTNFKSCLHISVYRNILINHLNRIKSLCSSHLVDKNIKMLTNSAVKYNFPIKFINSYLP